MSRRFANGLALAAFASVLLTATAAVPEPLPPPPLKPGEVIAITRNGCAVVSSPRTPEDRAKFREETALLEWRGPCRNGLAHGKGEATHHRLDGGPLSPYNTEYFFGRTPLISRSDVTRMTSYRTEDGRHAAATDDSTLESGYWGDADRPIGSQVSANGQSIYTVVWLPRVLDGVSKHSYSIWTSPGPNTDCPDWRTPIGCEGLWRQMTAPLIASYRALRAEVERAEPAWRANLTQLNAARDARFAALDSASAEAFRRSQTAAESEAGKADRDFRAALAAANAGRLFTMADEFESAGDVDKARQTLRALINRFPDHGLAVTAAQRLTALPPGSGSASAGDCAAPAQEAQFGQALRGAMSRIPASNAVWKYETILATIERSAAAWSRCPSHPSNAAKLATYRTAYIETARRCAMISPTGACTPNMH